MGAKNKKKKKPSTFEEIYAATRREWPVGFRHYSYAFDDKRRKERDQRIGKDITDVQNELMGYKD